MAFCHLNFLQYNCYLIITDFVASSIAIECILNAYIPYSDGIQNSGNFHTFILTLFGVLVLGSSGAVFWCKLFACEDK